MVRADGRHRWHRAGLARLLLVDEVMRFLAASSASAIGFALAVAGCGNGSNQTPGGASQGGASGSAVLAGGTANGGSGNTTGGSTPSSGGARAQGGTSSSGGSANALGGTSAGGANALGGSNAGGALSSGGTTNTGGTGGATTSNGRCAVTADRVRITEVDVGSTVVANEDEAALKVLALAPIPGGGSRLAWMGDDSRVHVTALDANDRVQGEPAAFPAMDFEDIYADAMGGVLLLTRDAKGGGTLNCGDPTNLCGTPPDPPIPCYDMYLVRFDGTRETWATQLTNASAALPPYSTGPTGPEVYMIWWYAHHGRIASDGANYAAYFGSAISISQEGCINIHQGDRMKIVAPDGSIQSGGFDWGCSHSGYERIVWDPATKKYVTVCKNDAKTANKSGKIAFAPSMSVIYPIDLSYSNLGNVVLARGGGYWLTTSDAQSGEPADSNGRAEVRLLHFTTGAPDRNQALASDATLNQRAPHLAAYGSESLLAAWESSSVTGDLSARDDARQLSVQSLDAATGEARGEPLPVNVRGNRYYEFKSYPDGSVAYAAPGSSKTKIAILRVLPCDG